MIGFWKPNIISKGLRHFKARFLSHKQSSISINVIIMASMILFVLSCGKSKNAVSEEKDEKIITVLEFESLSSFRLDMKELEYYCDDLTAAIKKKKWEKIRKYAGKLGKIKPVALTGLKKEELPEDFITFDSEYNLSTLKLLRQEKWIN